ncbi:hypothetical protein BURK1_03666 [Burkholderiales bacterium]|nr:hypothetical protein BURK1_03666 [Burkholderiales bacterium]
MKTLITKLERSVIAAVAVALSAITLAAATVAPANADQSALTAKLQPHVQTIFVSYERATRVN